MPFINGQWVDQGDFDFLGKYREGYDTAQNREAKKEAQVVYRAGDPRRAAEVLMPYDPEKANVYATEANRRAGVAYGRAYAGRNYDEARRIAQQEGNPQWAEQADRGERIQQFRDVSDTVEWVTGELANVSQLPKEQRPEAWKNLWYRAAAKSRNNPQWIAGIARIRQQFPEYSPEAAQALNGIVMQAAEAYASGDPEAYLARQTALAKAATDAREVAVKERNADIAEKRANAYEDYTAGLVANNGNKTEQRTFERAGALRDDYRSEPVVKGYQEIRNVYNRSQAYLRQGRPSPVGDIGLVFALAKINDPTSVVREQEFAQIAQSGGYGQQVKNWVAQAAGRGFDPQTRAELVRQITSAYSAFENTYKQTRASYIQLASRYGVDPADVVVGADDVAAAPEASTGSASGNTIAPTPGAPPPRPPNVPRTAKWDPQRNIWVP